MNSFKAMCSWSYTVRRGRMLQ